MAGCRFAGLIAILMSVSASVADELTPELSVKEIMNSIVTPATNTIWGAYQLETESQWQEVGHAATAVIGAANLRLVTRDAFPRRHRPPVWLRGLAWAGLCFLVGFGVVYARTL